MNIEIMRTIDRWLGTPLCHLMAAVAPALTLRAKRGPVVVCKFFGMGSICLGHPLLLELRDSERETVYLTFTGNRALAQFLGVERCITIDASSPWRFIGDVFRAVWRLRALRPVAFLNLEFFSRFAALMSVMSGAPVRAGFHMVHLPVGRLYTHRANLNLYRPMAENFLNVGVVAELVGAHPPLADYIQRFPAGNGASRPAEALEPYIVLNAESSPELRHLKSWPTVSWSALIEEIGIRYPDHALVMIGTRDGSTVAADIGRGLTNPDLIIDLSGRTDFTQFVDLIAGAALVITVDSAPLHLSAMMRRPTICLFGPEIPVLYGHDYPWVSTIYRGLMCSPCLAVYDAKTSVLDCRDNQCMKQIAVMEVLSAAERLLPLKAPARPTT